MLTPEQRGTVRKSPSTTSPLLGRSSAYITPGTTGTESSFDSYRSWTPLHVIRLRTARAGLLVGFPGSPISPYVRDQHGRSTYNSPYVLTERTGARRRLQGDAGGLSRPKEWGRLAQFAALSVQEQALREINPREVGVIERVKKRASPIRDWFHDLLVTGAEWFSDGEDSLSMRQFSINVCYYLFHGFLGYVAMKESVYLVDAFITFMHSSPISYLPEQVAAGQGTDFHFANQTISISCQRQDEGVLAGDAIVEFSDFPAAMLSAFYLLFEFLQQLFRQRPLLNAKRELTYFNVITVNDAELSDLLRVFQHEKNLNPDNYNKWFAGDADQLFLFKLRSVIAYCHANKGGSNDTEYFLSARENAIQAYSGSGFMKVLDFLYDSSNVLSALLIALVGGLGLMVRVFFDALFTKGEEVPAGFLGLNVLFVCESAVVFAYLFYKKFRLENFVRKLKQQGKLLHDEADIARDVRLAAIENLKKPRSTFKEIHDFLHAQNQVGEAMPATDCKTPMLKRVRRRAVDSGTSFDDTSGRQYQQPTSPENISAWCQFAKSHLEEFRGIDDAGVKRVVEIASREDKSTPAAGAGVGVGAGADADMLGVQTADSFTAV